MSGLPNITKSPSQKTKTLESILNGKIKKTNPFKTLPNSYKPNVSFLRNEKSDSKQDQYYSSPLLTKSQLTEVEHLTRQSRNDFYSQMLSENPFQYNEYQNNDSEYNKKISEIQVNLIDIKNKERVKEFLHETTSFQNQISTHTQRPKRINVLTQRQDVIKLAQWIDYQMEQIIGSKTMIEQQQLREIETVFNLSLKELVREISLDCVEKSVLLEKIWNQYANYNVYLLKSLEDDKYSQESGYLTQIKSLHQTYQNSVNFLEEKLRQIDEEFNRLSIKFDRKKFKLKTIRENFVNVTEQKKDMEEEITYLRTQKQDLLEKKEELQSQLEQLINENERLQLIIVSKQQELRTAKTKRYSQISLDSCASEQNQAQKYTSTEDFYQMMGLQQETHTQTMKNEDETQISVLIQTDIKFIQHQGSQTGLDDDQNMRSQNSSFYSLNKKTDQKELEEKLRIALQLNSDLQKARQLLLKEQEGYQTKINTQELSLSQLQKEFERVQQELQQLMQSRQQKKRTIITLEESNGDQMSLGPVKDLQKTPSNHQIDPHGIQKSNKFIEHKNQQDSNSVNQNLVNNQANNLQGAKSPQSKSQVTQNIQQNYQPDIQAVKKDAQQIQKRENHQRNLSDQTKSNSNNSSQIASKQQKVTALNQRSKEEIIQLKQQQQNQFQQFQQQQQSQQQQSQQQKQLDINKQSDMNKQSQQSTQSQLINKLTTIDTIQQLEINDKEQLNSQKIRNTLLNLNDNENEDIAQFDSINQDEEQRKNFKRSSTKKLSYKFNSSQHSQNTTVAIPQLQRKESYISPGPGNKSLRDKDMIYADVALEFIKTFTQSIMQESVYVRLEHPEEIEQTMSLQSVFKLITQFYQERLERKQPIYVICYEFYMNTFGLKQIAENKLTQLCQAVVFYKNVPRVKLFARFLQIIDGIKEDDLEFYFSTLAVLDQQQKAENLITCTQNMDCVQVPYEKAMDQLSTLKQQIQEVERSLRKNIQFVNGVGMVDVDLFFLEALQQFQLMRKIHKDNFKELFDAVDVNDDQQISVEEFQILFGLLEGKENLNEMKKKFQIACGKQDGLIFYQFGMFCLTHELFKKEKQDNFLKFDKEEFMILKQKWNEIRRQITARLKQSLSFTDYYQDLVRKLDYGIKNNVSHTWLLWRILEEQSKKLLIEQIVNSIIGVKLNYICQKID